MLFQMPVIIIIMYHRLHQVYIKSISHKLLSKVLAIKTGSRRKRKIYLISITKKLSSIHNTIQLQLRREAMIDNRATQHQMANRLQYPNKTPNKTSSTQWSIKNHQWEHRKYPPSLRLVLEVSKIILVQMEVQMKLISLDKRKAVFHLHRDLWVWKT